MLLDAILNNNTFVLEYRVNLAGMPINIYDGLTALLFLGCLIPRSGRRHYFHADHTHGLLIAACIAFSLAFLIGVFGAAIHGVNPRDMFTSARNLATFPLFLVIAYRLTMNFPRCIWLLRMEIVAGVAAAVLIAWSFLVRGQEVFHLRDVNLLRESQYVSNFAGIAAALLLYMVVSDVTLMPRLLAIILAICCFGGQFATLARSDWVACMSGIVVVFFLLPKKQRFVRAVASLAGIAGLLVALWIGITLADRITGHDLQSVMIDRVRSLLPGYTRDTGRAQAWDTRTEAAAEELILWMQSPVIGRGLAIQNQEENALMGYSFKHNAWTSTLAETGLIGFSGMLLVFGGVVLVGARMVRDRLDRTSVLVGALGVITGVHMAVLGVTTMSFNGQRPAILVAIVGGLVWRCRAMQQTVIRAQRSAPANSVAPVSTIVSPFVVNA